MFSKLLRCGALVLTLGFILSCTRFFNEKRQNEDVIRLSNEKLVCLKGLPDSMVQYAHGEASPAAIRSGFECAENALSYFKIKTRGTYGDTYTTEDLRNFFGKYFLKENNVTPAFESQLFKLKQVLIGGTDKLLTKNELQKLVDLLDLVKDEAVTLEPSMPVLMMQKKSATSQDIQTATAQLEVTLWALFHQVDLINSDYGFQDLKNFADGLNEFLNTQEPAVVAKSLETNLPLLEAIKDILMGPRVQFIDQSDWHTALHSLVGLYDLGLKDHYLIDSTSFSTPAKVAQMMPIVDEALNLITTCLPFKRQQAIPFTAIDTLLQKLEERHFLSTGLTASALQSTYKIAVLRVLDPGRQNDSRGLDGLEVKHWLTLRQEWEIYKLYQNFIDGLSYDKSLSLRFADMAANYASYPVETKAAEMEKENDLTRMLLINAWKDGKSLLLRPWPVLFGATGKILITENPQEQTTTWSSLTRWNLMRTLTRFMILGYANNNPAQNFVQAQILEPDLAKWYDEFRPLGLELKAFDPRAGNSGARSFSEANFFTFSGNGDNVMDLQETFEFVSLLVAGGLSSAEKIREDLIQRGCGLPQNDVFGYPFLNDKCFEENFHAHFAEYFDNLPGAVKEVQKQTPAQWTQFYTDLRNAVHTNFSPTNGTFDTADLRSFVVILHYTEILMVVYDTDHSNGLSVDEVKAGAARFMSYIRQQSPTQEDAMVRDFFAFMVFKGEKPGLNELMPYTTFQGEKLLGILGDANRDNVFKVFSVLKGGPTP